MRNNLSNSELLSYYEEESEKLRVFARKCGLDHGAINKIVHKSLYAHGYKNKVGCGEKHSLLNTCIRKYSAQLCVLKVLFVFVLIVTALFIVQLYQKTVVNFIVRNVQELIYPAMKVLRFLSLPVVTNVPSITAWYDEICLIENPYFQASDMNCWPCEEVRSVLDLSETAEPVKQLPHAGFPFVIKGVSPKVTLSDIQIMYFFNKHIFDRDASRVISSESWNTIEELVHHRLSENPTCLRMGHISWRINRLEPARIIRSMFKRPHFFPNTVNVERYILIDEANSPPYYQPLPEGYRVFLMQSCGERLIILEPVPGCSNNCSRVSVLLQPSDILYYNSWFYRAKSMPVTNSSSISITYIGSY